MRKPDITVEKVEGLSADFLLGADVSSMIALENSGVVYRNFEGQPQDLIQTLKESGLNTVRVRLWKDPYTADGHGYGGGNCDLDNAIAIGKRVMAQGMSLLVDFHYSDFWADPGKQKPPKAWAALGYEDKAIALETYTAECLQAFADAGVKVSMVQIGNETTGGFCGEWTAETQYPLMARAAAAVRSFDPNIRILVHYTNPEKGGYPYFAEQLQKYGVDYDIFASSYYPAWHGTVDNLTQQLRSVAEGYGKKVMVAEIAWDRIAYNGQQSTYPYSVQGQADAIHHLVSAMATLEDAAVGVCYWEPAWLEVPNTSWEQREKLWEQYGTGWASSYAGEYDPEDAGQYYGASGSYEQSLFAEDGTPLASLLTFTYIRTGEAGAT